eukprot:TRINITY_DN24614_c0_g1_i1.p1 TRINITY_DN24614_c0_g1~~TRINITY_DN24614_c0_g1_i1.p1  ORF type:complete len:350 (+),score=159.95 TRINITY_DN24614_c0_g1_i1:58-1107(+)
MAEKRDRESTGSEQNPPKKMKVGDPACPPGHELYPEYQHFYNPNNHTGKGIDENGPKGRLIDGKGEAAKIRKTLKAEIAELKADEEFVSREPGLAVILVGSDPASKVYIGQKTKACAEVGIKGIQIDMPPTTTVDELMAKIDALNADDAIDGILLQLPLPEGPLRDATNQAIERIDAGKDVDGFHPTNLGYLVARQPRFRPCTPWGCMQLLYSTGVNPYGLECLVVGASNHVGRAMALELLLAGCSVQVAHRFTRDLEAHVRRAECVIVAAGKAGLVKGEWIRPGAVVIDIGINRLAGSKKLVGDVDFDAAKERAGYITPVPGGVGPMTVAMLLSNTVLAFRNHRVKKA